MRKNSAKCEKVRAKYVTGMRSDSSQTVRAKNFSAKKVDYSSTFLSFRLRNPFADQSESKSPWQGGTTDQWVTHSSACDVNRSSEMA